MNVSPNNNAPQLSYLCAPALIYLIFSFTQIIIDMFKGLYNTAFLKFMVMILFTLLLNALCESGLGIVSWVIVFVPFILMSLITGILLYVFGLDPATGKLEIKDKTDTYNRTGKIDDDASQHHKKKDKNDHYHKPHNDPYHNHTHNNKHHSKNKKHHHDPHGHHSKHHHDPHGHHSNHHHNPHGHHLKEHKSKNPFVAPKTKSPSMLTSPSQIHN